MRFLAVAVPVLLAAVLLSGCSLINRTPRYDIGAPYEIQTFKRRTLHQGQDYVWTWKKDAYSQVNKPITQRLSPSQKNLIERHGQPDYIRKGWRATTGEIVDEWAYWDRDIVAQFVQRELVFEGPLTDMDRYRIRYGNPRRAWAQKYESGVQRDMWQYHDLSIATRGVIVTFSDEQLVSEQTY